ncbi:hypothetical protein [Pseudomonas sp. nanlin1]|uniref:hypothetical protein n=1 Tax=Pseudomonas sp. nanlin1 TaxID=3040605 RepID=UPI00388DAF39
MSRSVGVIGAIGSTVSIFLMVYHLSEGEVFFSSIASFIGSVVVYFYMRQQAQEISELMKNPSVSTFFKALLGTGSFKKRGK